MLTSKHQDLYFAGLNIQQSYNILGGTIFHHLVHHLLIGRQVILRGKSDVIISALIKSIQVTWINSCHKNSVAGKFINLGSDFLEGYFPVAFCTFFTQDIPVY